jgi:nucleoside-diphosphate kinase
VIQQTLVLIKPDAIRKDVGFEIMSIYSKNGLEIKRSRVLSPMSHEMAMKLYKEHAGKDFYKPLINFMTQGIVVALLIEGDDAIKKVKEINGATNPPDAAEGTIRKMFGTNNRENAVHGSDENSAEREIQIFF